VSQPVSPQRTRTPWSGSTCSPALPPEIDDRTELSEDERAYVGQVEHWEAHEGAYEHQQRTRPLTLAYGLSNSPVGLLAWLVEKLRGWSDCDV
jgi:hypothetical protein